MLLLLISLLPVLSVFRPGTYESGDLSINAVKTMSFYKSLQEGNFLPHWASDLNALYGYPLFIYTYPLPYYIASFFHFLGFSYINSIKALLIVSFVLSGVTMFLFLKTILKPIPTFVGSIFYLFAPYHLVDMHFRVDIGETLSFVFLPLIFYSIYKQITKRKFRWIALTSVSFACLLLSHQAVSLTFAPFILIFVILNSFQDLPKKSIFLSLLLGIFLSSFYLIPILWESPLTHQFHHATVYFFPIWSYLFSPWQFGLLFQGHHGELSFIIGYPQLLIILFSFYLLYVIVRHRYNSGKATPFLNFINFKNFINSPSLPLFLFSLFSVLLLFLVMQSFTAPLWYVIPFIKNFQFSYRLMVVIVFFVSILAAIVTQYIPQKKLILLLCAVTIISTILNWGNRRIIPEITDNVLAKSLPESTAQAEGLFPAMPIWTDIHHPFMKTRPSQPVQILKGTAKIKTLKRTTTSHEYNITADTPVKLQENTLYYPGWTVFANKKNIPITYTSPTAPGIIQFSLPKGIYTVRVLFKETADRLIGMWLSGITLIMLLITAFYTKIKNIL